MKIVRICPCLSRFVLLFSIPLLTIIHVEEYACGGVLLFSFKGIFSSGFMPGLFYSSEKRKIFQQYIH